MTASPSSRPSSKQAGQAPRRPPAGAPRPPESPPREDARGEAVPWRWIVFALGSSLFALSQFYRATPAVIAPQLMEDLALDPQGLSILSAALFYAFALVQIPVGMFLDTLGPRKTMTALALVAAAGSLLFARAESLEAVTVARILLGVGTAGSLIGTYKLLTAWFPARFFATLSALVISAGAAGGILAATPLVLLVSAVGWRHAFVLFAGVNLLLGVLFFALVRDGTPGVSEDRPRTPLAETAAGLGRLLQRRDFWLISAGTFCRYGIFAAVQALWAGPYLLSVMQLSPVAAGNILLLLSIGLIAGGPVAGNLSDLRLKSRKGVVIPSLASSAAILALLALLRPGTAAGVLALLFFLFGFCNGGGNIMYAHIKECVPASLAATAMTAINLFTMFGAAVFLQGIGSLLQRLYPGAALTPEAFRSVLLACAACLGAAAILYLFTRETAGRPAP